jgi:ComF family protein
MMIRVEIFSEWVLWGGRLALDLALPPQCACCDAPVQRQGQLCAACFGRLNFIAAPCCRRCGVPFASAGQGGEDSVCQACEAKPPLFEAARAALLYDAHSRHLILPFKHGDRQELASVLAAHMARAGATLLARADLIVPVPLHRWRLFRRRYNQAALLARALGRLAGLPVLLDGLVRRRPTPPMGGKTAEERAQAVADVFQVRPARGGRLRGRRALLVDDVLTSGATANACTRALVAAGASAVDVLVAARVPDPRTTRV